MSDKSFFVYFDHDAHEKLPSRPWDGVSPLYSGLLEEFFDDIESLRVACEMDGAPMADYGLLVCDPVYGAEIGGEDPIDLLPALDRVSGELDMYVIGVHAMGPEVVVAIENLNAALRSSKTPIGWRVNRSLRIDAGSLV